MELRNVEQPKNVQGLMIGKRAKELL